MDPHPFVYIHLNVDIVSGNDSLPSNSAYLNFDVDNAEPFCTNVDLNKARIYRLVELSETSDKTNRT